MVVLLEMCVECICEQCAACDCPDDENFYHLSGLTDGVRIIQTATRSDEVPHLTLITPSSIRVVTCLCISTCAASVASGDMRIT